MNKRLLTSYRGGILTSVWEDGRIRQFDWEKQPPESKIGNIYVGNVKKVVPGIQAAFVDVGGGLTGYYSLAENTGHIFLSEGCHDQVKPGDMLLVQVEKDPVRNKAMVLTSRLTLTGRYMVLTWGSSGLSFSRRLENWIYKDFKEKVRKALSGFPTDRYGLTVRTNASAVSPEQAAEEAGILLRQMERLKDEAVYRLSGCLMSEALPAWLQGIRDARDEELEEIVTDNSSLFARLSEFVRNICPSLENRIRYYSDDYPLYKLYSLETALKDALLERVWLKSGGFLVIQPTEAMTVIDVNTGKYTGKKSQEETFFSLNLEAAKEIAIQLQLRNLSGIIMVDFIDMRDEGHREELMKAFGRLLAEDRVKTTLVDMTPLGLAEITRKKVRKPLAEQLAFVKNDENNVSFL